MSFRVALAVLCVSIVACIPPGVAPPPAPPRATHLGLEITTMHVANGLQVEVVRDPKASGIHVTMRYRVGSAEDPAEHLGMAHLVEHLMFQQILGAQSIFAHLEDIATAFNAFTSYDATTYLAAADASHLDELLSIEAVRVGMRCTSITASAFEREREVVVNELRQRDEATEVLSALHRGLYPSGHPYRNPITGTEESVRTITREAACAFADRYYAPSNAVLVISGDITVDRVQASLGKFMAHVAKRTVDQPTPLPPVQARPRRVELEARIGTDSLLVAWPLPDDPLERAKLRALAGAVAGVVDAEIRGQVEPIELGDVRAPMIGLVVIPATTETIDDVTHGIERGLDALPNGLSSLRGKSLGALLFDRIQQTAIYSLFSALEEGDDRDTRLAEYALEGRDPSDALAREFQGLREMTPGDAGRVARERLTFEQATVVLLHASGKKDDHHIHLQAALHDLGRRRDPADPSAAQVPLPHAPHASIAQSRTLPNGLTVVLVPSSTVPTVDIRLVFAAGTADELPDKRGAALVAGDSLAWDYRYLNDLLAFAAAGGTDLVDVGDDRTTFEARGLDMHLDYLLTGLRRWVREGRYEPTSVAEAMRREAKRTGDDAFLNAWRGALYGASHPYVAAGLVRAANEHLSSADAMQFRADHFTPDNATLVITGHFDPVLANRWIDFLFSDWTGRAHAGALPAATLQPASLARAEEAEQIALEIALPATTGSRAARLVAVEMLADLAGDVRHQLGASYGLSARLVEARLTSYYAISGRIDPKRAREAIELLAKRIDELRRDPEAAARAFVVGRERAIVALAAPLGRATALAAEVEHDVAMHRAPLFDRGTADEVPALTIDAMTETLAGLDLARAAIVMRGPRADIDAAYGALERTATYIDADAKHAPAKWEATASSASIPDEVEAALTAQPTPPRSGIAFGVQAAYALMSIDDRNAGGFVVSGDLGKPLGTVVVGAHVGIGSVAGSYQEYLEPEVSFSAIPIDLKCYIFGMYDQFWGRAAAGFHTDYVSAGTSSWHSGFGIDLAVGANLVDVGRFRLGPFVGTGYVLGGDVSSSSIHFGLALQSSN